MSLQFLLLICISYVYRATGPVTVLKFQEHYITSRPKFLPIPMQTESSQMQFIMVQNDKNNGGLLYAELFHPLIVRQIPMFEDLMTLFKQQLTQRFFWNYFLMNLQQLCILFQRNCLH